MLNRTTTDSTPAAMSATKTITAVVIANVGQSVQGDLTGCLQDLDPSPPYKNLT